MKSLGINYDEKRNCFDDIKHIKSDLIWGDLKHITNPWFSYILPVYKRADLLKETLDSVLNQRPVDFAWDIVVVDNEAGGENDTERLIRQINDPRILYYRNQENLGPDGNYNRCIEIARGEWLAMLHGDDLIIDDHLQRMGKYIKAKQNGRKPLAYISVGYQDFKDRSTIHIRREDIVEPYVSFRNKLKMITQTDTVITGFSVALPSFGTVMNKRVMLETGGFNEALGICEDVITPYKLMKDYRVYVTPEIMGYHRFEGNESIKHKTIFRICEAMCDFREYMFSRNVFTKIWGSVARTAFFDLLTEYCSFLSGYTEQRLKKEDFAYIYPERKPMNMVQKTVFHIVMSIYCFITGSITYEKGIEQALKRRIKSINSKITKDGVIIYGAGRAGKTTERILKKKYGLKVNCFAVSSVQGSEKRIDGIEVREIGDVSDEKNCLVLLATSVPEFYDEMKNNIAEKGFTNYIALDERFESEEKEIKE